MKKSFNGVEYQDNIKEMLRLYECPWNLICITLRIENKTEPCGLEKVIKCSLKPRLDAHLKEYLKDTMSYDNWIKLKL